MVRLTSKLFLAAVVALLLLPKLSLAQPVMPSPAPDTTPAAVYPYNDWLSLGYYDITINDNIVRLMNPTQSDNSPAYAPGLLCAMVYVFDAHEELQECCGCPVTNNGLRKLSVKTDLISNPEGGGIPPTGLVLVVSAFPNKAPGTPPNLPGPCPPNTTCTPYVPCDPGVAYNATPEFPGFITHVDQNHGAQNVSEVQMASLSTDTTTIYTDPTFGLVALCGFIHLNATGNGICTCGTGDTVAAQAGVVAP
jgi:hypothetical protein